jgi:hypothetical protein
MDRKYDMFTYSEYILSAYIRQAVAKQVGSGQPSIALCKSSKNQH